MLNLQESRFFNSLPELIKESIMQCGIDFQNEAELQQFVSNVNKKS